MASLSLRLLRGGMILCISPPTHAALELAVSSLANIFTRPSRTSFFINSVTTSIPWNCLPLWLLSSSGLLSFEASVWFYGATTKTAYLRLTQAARATLECNVVCVKSGFFPQPGISKLSPSTYLASQTPSPITLAVGICLQHISRDFLS